MFFSCISIWHSADSDAERLLAQVIAQAWDTWKSNLLEQKRLRSILAKVARHWKNRVSTHILFMHQYLVHDDSDAIVDSVCNFRTLMLVFYAGYCTRLEQLVRGPRGAEIVQG
jgi:hypothetical protein